MTGAPGRLPTLEEVARLAGVGRGTASRVINGGAQVSERSRRAVEDAIEQLGYVPNPAARTLVTRRTNAIALVIAESEERIFGEPYFAGAIRGISAELNDAGLQLVLLWSQLGRRGAPLDTYLTPQHVDGVLLLSVHDDDTLPERLRSRGIPVVLGGRVAGNEAGGFVDVDNERGARLAVEHLALRGRRRIACIAGPADMVAGRDRLAGFRSGLAAAGLAGGAELVVHGDFSQPSGEQAMRELLTRDAEIDGVFCANDLMAAGALEALRDAGRQVPEDVSVVGFEDAPMSQLTHPPLTTVHQSPDRMGREMVHLLLRIIAEHPDPLPSRILATRLVVRGSS